MEINKALENYVKFYYEKLDEHEEILTENLHKICYALDLQDYEDELKYQINDLPPTDLRNKEIDSAKLPKWLNREYASSLYKEIRDLTDKYEPQIRKELN